MKIFDFHKLFVRIIPIAKHFENLAINFLVAIGIVRSNKLRQSKIDVTYDLTYFAFSFTIHSSTIARSNRHSFPSLNAGILPDFAQSNIFETSTSR